MHLVVFIPTILLLIILHELGHMLAAKLFGIPVDEFGIGLPPRLVTLFKWGETHFTLNALPLGGFVRLRGDGDPSVPNGLAAASPYKRVGVYMAGPLMNILLGVVLYVVMLQQAGAPISGTVTVNQINPGSPGAQAGLMVGDRVISLDGVEIEFLSDLQRVAADKGGKEIAMLIERDGERHAVQVTPRAKPPQGEGPIGIVLRSQYRPLTLIQAIPRGLASAYQHIASLLTWPLDLVKGESDAVGLAGMYRIFTEAAAQDGEAASEQLPSVGVLSFWASITLSLGVLNLFPIPALDGGRVLFTLPELLLRRRIPVQLEQSLNIAFFLILMALMIYVNVQEII